MADKLPGGQTRVEVPQTEGLVPRGREGELAVRRDGNVRDKVVVAVEDLLGETERGVISGELPDDDGLVYAQVASAVWPSRIPAIHQHLPGKSMTDYSPLEAVKIMSGFSDEVATAVIQFE